MNSCLCPVCGGQISMDVQILVDANMVIGKGRYVQLPRREMDILIYLRRRIGKICPPGLIIDAVYNRELDIAPNILESHISKLNKKIKPFGLKIKGFRFQGYQLIMEAQS